MYGDERVVAKDANQMRVSTHAEFLTEECERDRIERPPTSTWPSVWTIRSPLVKNGNGSAASGPWMRRRAIVRFQ
jgi:hypothetical protein